MMSIERVQIPSEYLALFATADHTLWTPSLTVVRKTGDPVAEVRIDPRPPQVLGATAAVSAAHRRGNPSIVVRALGAWLN